LSNVAEGTSFTTISNGSGDLMWYLDDGTA
jgi:hypothetical protein